MMAARTADAPLMQLLADLGADPLLVNEDNTTVLMAAAGLGTHSPGEDAGIDSEKRSKRSEIAVELGIDVNAVNKDGDTAMHGAAYKQFPSGLFFRTLAGKGARIQTSGIRRTNRDGRPCGLPSVSTEECTSGVRTPPPKRCGKFCRQRVCQPRWIQNR